MFSARRLPRILGMIVQLGLLDRRPGRFRAWVFVRRRRRNPLAGGPGQGKRELQEEVQRFR